MACQSRYRTTRINIRTAVALMIDLIISKSTSFKADFKAKKVFLGRVERKSGRLVLDTEGPDDKMPARNFFLEIVAKAAIILINVGWQFIGEVIKQRFNYRRTAGLPFFLWNTIAQNRYRSLKTKIIFKINHFLSLLLWHIGPLYWLHDWLKTSSK